MGGVLECTALDGSTTLDRTIRCIRCVSHFKLHLSRSLTVTDEAGMCNTGDFVGMFVDAQAKILPVGNAYNSA